MIKISENKRIPAFSLQEMNGRMFNSDDLLRKKNLIIFVYPNFEKSLEYLSMLDALYPDLKYFNTEVVSIAPDSNLKETFKNIHLLFDREGKVAQKFIDQTVPAIFITDKFHILFEYYIDQPTGHLPDKEQILKTIEYIESRCPECSDNSDDL